LSQELLADDRCEHRAIAMVDAGPFLCGCNPDAGVAAAPFAALAGGFFQ